MTSALLGGGLALAATLLLAGPAAADEPFGPDCTFYTTPPGGATDEPVVEPTDEATDEPTSDVTAEPDESVTPDPGEGAGDPTDAPPVDATDEPTPDVTDDPTDEPTADPTDEPTGEPGPEPTGYWACMTPDQALGGEAGGTGGFTGGSGEASGQLPFSGAPVGRYLATGLGLLVAGTGTVLVARRRTG